MNQLQIQFNRLYLIDRNGAKRSFSAETNLIEALNAFQVMSERRYAKFTSQATNERSCHKKKLYLFDDTKVGFCLPFPPVKKVWMFEQKIKKSKECIVRIYKPYVGTANHGMHGAVAKSVARIPVTGSSVNR